ncbi:MAG TPA: CinA family protein [Caulobacteraceae bacterium]|nr:CinA family protein [Caulobacteraceae bacterium]
MFPTETQRLAEAILHRARGKHLTLATAESCTGGLAAAALTGIAGSSDVVDRGFVTYSNAAKTELLGVPGELIEREGAVSEAVVRAMAEGALKASAAGLAVAITGIAGPGGGSDDKPVGLVWLATALRDSPTTVRQMRYGDLGREGVRMAAVFTALEMMFERLE